MNRVEPFEDAGEHSATKNLRKRRTNLGLPRRAQAVALQRLKNGGDVGDTQVAGVAVAKPCAKPRPFNRQLRHRSI